MPTSTPALLLLVLATALGGGCLTPKQLDTDSYGDTGGDVASGASIFDINDGTVPLDQSVTLTGVVATSAVDRAAEGFYIGDPTGGPGSGLYVWEQAGMAGFTIAPGDEITLTGTPTDYHDWIEFIIASTDDVTVTGTAALPPATDLGDGTGVDWNQYESVLVTLDDQTITTIDQYDTATLSGGINMDDGFLFNDFECRASYASVTGLVAYRYATWSINARDAADLGAYTAAETIPATVADIEGGVCGPVTLTGVVATSANADKDDTSLFFVQDAGGGDLSGMAAFTPNGTANVAVGDTLTLTGVAGDYFGYGLTEISLDDAAADITATGSGATPVAEPVDAAPTDWEPYEGMLVTLTDVDITGDPSYGETSTNYGIFLDDLFYDGGAINGDHYTSVTGLVYYSYSEWKIEPRDATDIVL